MKLQEVLQNVHIHQAKHFSDVEVPAITVDSRAVERGGMFIAIKGETVDGHQYIGNAIEKGAKVIVCEVLPSELNDAVTYVQVVKIREAVAIIAGNFYRHPSKELKLVGVTGTNGKTTIATLGHQLYSGLGVRVGLLSTIENKIGGKVYPSKLTTPDPISLNQLLRNMVDAGCDIAFMEVSSHAVEQQRIFGLEFSAGIFTNITRDHLDYHKTFKAYIEAKQKFFTALPKTAFGLYNSDDKNGEVMLQNSRARKISYGQKTLAEYKVKVLENSLDGLLLNLNGKEFYTRLTGEFNAMNLTAVYATAVELGEDRDKVLQVLSSIAGAEGRLEKVVSKTNVVAVVDYAHTPDALEKVLETINKSRTGQEQLITVVGCGGNRDAGKRPIMASVSVEQSTKAILTSDNPRNENPVDIIEEMAKGVKITQQAKMMKITDRKDAIRTAVSMANTGDIILVAGKGHEKYQEIKGERFPFDDKKIIKEAFEEFNK